MYRIYKENYIRPMKSEILQELESLEQVSRLLEEDSNLRSDWIDAVKEYANHFIDDLDNQSVYVDRIPTRLQRITFTEEGKRIKDLLEILHDQVDSLGINTASGGHLGYIPGGGLFPAALGDFLAAVTNRYAGSYYTSPGAVTIEQQCIDWMARLIGMPPSYAGNLTSGGSIATLTAVIAAREHFNIEPESIRKKSIYLTVQTHHCLKKALCMTGLHFAAIREVPLTDTFEMNAARLSDMIESDRAKGLEPFMIVGSAGTTDTGIIDPLAELAAISKRYGCWFHVDAAYGGFFKLLDSMALKFKGIEEVDSVVLDPHKSLFISYGLGAVIIRDRKVATKAFAYRANYMQDSYGDFDVLDPSDTSIELTKHFRGLRMWMSLQLLGIRPIRASLQEKLCLTSYFYHEVSALGYEVGPQPTLSVCLFRKTTGRIEQDNLLNMDIHAQILASNKIYLSTTTIEGVLWLRICIMVFRAHKRHIDSLLELLREFR